MSSGITIHVEEISRSLFFEEFLTFAYTNGENKFAFQLEMTKRDRRAFASEIYLNLEPY